MVLKHVQEIKDHMHYYMHICKLLHRNILYIKLEMYHQMKLVKLLVVKFIDKIGEKKLVD